MNTRPLYLAEANAFVQAHHRHNEPVTGYLFAQGAIHEKRLVGVAIVGRVGARKLHNPLTAEVTRLTVLDDAPKGTCSYLYNLCRGIWFRRGGTRLITYTLLSESGASLRGAGWSPVPVKPNAQGWLSRPGRVLQPVTAQEKIRWETRETA